MFEGKPPTAHTSLPADLPHGQQEGLRTISWPELVAQLDAARAFRSAPGAGETEGEASFDPHHARHIAALCDGKPNVNLNDLADGKPAVGNSRSATNGAARDDRENR